MQNPFFTEVAINHQFANINYNDKLMFMGSCFAESIGNEFLNAKFQTLLNPFGIVYNPTSVAKCLRHVVNKKVFKEEDLFKQNEVWKSLDFHSRFSHREVEECLSLMNCSIENAHTHLKNCHTLFITFGTSWVYQWKETGKIVANCHKHRADCFNRIQLSINDIVLEYTELIELLMQFNPKLNIIFTVSPIRHWKDGAHQNQLSKATLLLGISQLLKKLKNEQLQYFPSYEIVLDELRDYRFYADDMVHLNTQAIKHIWGKVKKAMLADSCHNTMKQIEKLNKALTHRTSNPNSKEYQQFIQTNLQLITELKKQHPQLCFLREQSELNKKLTTIYK